MKGMTFLFRFYLNFARVSLKDFWTGEKLFASNHECVKFILRNLFRVRYKYPGNFLFSYLENSYSTDCPNWKWQKKKKKFDSDAISNIKRQVTRLILTNVGVSNFLKNRVRRSSARSSSRGAIDRGDIYSRRNRVTGKMARNERRFAR